MSVISILEKLFIGPLKLIFELIFEFAYRLVGHPGMAIIFLSLIMNILVLPLYRRADAMQEESRDTENRLRKGVSHIKKTFSGDERMMILQTYYRQNNYKPTNALNGSVSLLLEIPFFMAAYQFLSHLEILNGVSLGPIKDLGAPDGLLVIGGIAINVLPVIMTLVNVISSALYLKGFPLKTKIQLYGMALFFLVFLYTSPACLVFYWTLNNVFSLVKTIFYKIKHPKEVLAVLTAILGVGLAVYGGFVYETESLKRRVFLVALGAALLLPLLVWIFGKFIPKKAEEKSPAPNKAVFWLGAIFLTVLVGVLIPSAYISASPQEYVDMTYFHHPIWYIVSSVSLAAGTFIVWMGVFYWLASPKGKVLFDKLVWILCGVTIVNYMFFGTDLGVISSILQYENGLSFTRMDQLVNLGVLAALAAVMFFIATKFKKVTAMVLLTAVVAIGGMSAVNIVTINKSISEISALADTESDMPNFNLSKTGKNVVVIMLDRAMNEYVPYLMNEKPELKEQFAGFTHYTNTISFGGFTNICVPSLMGGYEYTPVEMNKRDDEKLVDKHNEALKVMPVTFMNEGYDVTVCDPVYAGYRWYPDLSIYDEYSDKMDVYNTKGLFGGVDQKEEAVTNNHRNFFCFSIMKSMPVFLQSTIYNGGRYNQIVVEKEKLVYSVQTQDGTSKSTGLYSAFMNCYDPLNAMTNMTRITEDEQNTFLLFTNDITHEPMLLQTPDYVPAQNVDNTEYDEQHKDRFVVDGKELRMENNIQMIHYHANMAAFLAVGEWLDYLRANDVYDNTKIIIVADHGRNLNHFDELIHDDGSNIIKDVEFYYPLLMVKDFNSTEFTTSDEFMTNADVPTLAMKDLIENPVNPFTGKPINSDEKTAHDQFLCLSKEFDVTINNGTTYLPAPWASFNGGNVWDKDSWTFYDEFDVFNDYKAP